MTTSILDHSQFSLSLCSRAKPLLIKNDHKYPGSSSDAPVTVILYAEIGSAVFPEWHKELAKLAKDGKIVYLLRHFIKVR